MDRESPPSSGPAPKNRPVQFSLQTLLFGMVGAAVALQSAIWLGPGSLVFLVAALATYLAATGHRRHFFVWLVPALWTICAFGSWQHPGDEYGLFLLSLLPSVWLAVLLRSGNLLEIHALLIGAGTLSMLLLGFLLDRMAASRLLWAAVYVAASVGLFSWSLSSFPTLQAAIGKNGSLSAYAYAAANAGMYLAVLAAMIVSGARAAARPWRRSRG